MHGIACYDNEQSVSVLPSVQNAGRSAPSIFIGSGEPSPEIQDECLHHSSQQSFAITVTEGCQLSLILQDLLPFHAALLLVHPHPERGHKKDASDTIPDNQDACMAEDFSGRSTKQAGVNKCSLGRAKTSYTHARSSSPNINQLRKCRQG